MVEGMEDGSEARDGSCAQVVAVGKASGKDDDVRACQIARLVPEEFRLLAQRCLDGAESVVVTIAAGKYNDSEFHMRQPLKF